MPRPAGARSPAAHSFNEESKDSSLRSESLPPNQNLSLPTDKLAVRMGRPPRTENIRFAVKYGPHASSSASGKQSSEFLPEVDWKLIEACVPQPIARWLASAAARRVTSLLREAVDAGWHPGRVYGTLIAARLPSEVSNGPGLVIHRVEAIARTDPPAGAVGGALGRALIGVGRRGRCARSVGGRGFRRPQF